MQIHESGSDSNSTIIQMITQMNNNFSTRLGSIEQGLSKLGQIENKISLMRAEVLNMKEVNMDFNKRLMVTEIFCQNNSDTFDEIRQRNDMNSQQVTMLKNENQSLKSDLSQIKADFHNLKEDYLDLKSRSMQENLLFFGLAEQRPADGQMRPERENVEAKLRDFLSNELSLESPNIIENIVFDRVHRLGPPRRDIYDKPRPIIAEFEKFTDRETIRKAGIQLNSNPDSRFRIREQYPEEIENRRRQLYPVMYRLNKIPNNRVTLIKDRVYVNGSQYVPENDPDYRPSQLRMGGRLHSVARSRDRQRMSSNTNKGQFTTPKMSSYPSHGDIQAPSIPLSNTFKALSSFEQQANTGPAARGSTKNKASSPLQTQSSPKKQRELGDFVSEPSSVTRAASVPNLTRTDKNQHCLKPTVSYPNKQTENTETQSSQQNAVSHEPMDSTNISQSLQNGATGGNSDTF